MVERTSAYRFTTDNRNDPGIHQLRDNAKHLNSLSTWEAAPNGQQKRKRFVVSVKGRVGKNNPNADKIDWWQKKHGGIPLGLAGYYDVYWHERWDYRNDPDYVAPVVKKQAWQFQGNFESALDNLIDDFLSENIDMYEITEDAARGYVARSLNRKVGNLI